MLARFSITKFFSRNIRLAISELKKGEWIRYNNKPHSIVGATSIQSGRNCRIYSLQLKPIDSPTIFTVRPNNGETFEVTSINDSVLRFQYEDEDNLYLTNDKTFEEVAVPKRVVNHALFDTLEAGQMVRVRIEGDGAPVYVEGLRVTECTVARVDLLEEKKGIATLQSGVQVAVPGFIKAGDRISVDTETRSYLTRTE